MTATEGTEQFHEVTLMVNGVQRRISVPARRLLSDALRHDLQLTGTHVGCEHGVCGSCTVLVDGEPMPFVLDVRGLRPGLSPRSKAVGIPPSGWVQCSEPSSSAMD